MLNCFFLVFAKVPLAVSCDLSFRQLLVCEKPAVQDKPKEIFDFTRAHPFPKLFPTSIRFSIIILGNKVID
ncbi:unnamed protein product [Linum trigynum]|uniref:Secreted protein n=1 Tax=Linum trigynum TaxID=586398 RepID=A0AAV2FS17_9ROSI